MSPDRTYLCALRQWFLANAALGQFVITPDLWIDAANYITTILDKYPDPELRIKQLENQIAVMRKKRKPHP